MKKDSAKKNVIEDLDMSEKYMRGCAENPTVLPETHTTGRVVIFLSLFKNFFRLNIF